MIHYWKGLDLEITDFNYKHDPAPSGETIPSQTSRYVIRGHYFIMRGRVKKSEAPQTLLNFKSKWNSIG